jgi:hypothetical protein
MHSPPFPDLSVQLTRRRSRCVLDPNLALSRNGAMLARCLVPYAELWIGPEIHNILDSVNLYQREPQLLVLPGADKHAIAEIPEALRDWTRLRDARARGLYWVGDAYRESSMPEDIDDRFVLRWELASRALDLCLPKKLEATGPRIAAMRDAAALCAVLSSGWILGYGADGEPPVLCRYLQQWGLVCQELPATDALVSVERGGFQRLLIETGAAPFAWGGLPLAVLHLLVPNIGRIETGPDFGQEDEADVLALRDDEERARPLKPWEEATCFWYDLTGPAF